MCSFATFVIVQSNFQHIDQPFPIDLTVCNFTKYAEDVLEHDLGVIIVFLHKFFTIHDNFAKVLIMDSLRVFTKHVCEASVDY